MYLFGHDTTLPNSRDATLLARANYSDLLAGQWDRLQFWTIAGWESEYVPTQMLPLNVPSWETTTRWSTELQSWYTFNADMGNQISLWTAAAMTDTWVQTKVYTIPPPFTYPGIGPKESWICYAAKSHPELSTASSTTPSAAPLTSPSTPTVVELVFSYICNTWGNATVTRAQEFQPGGMDPEIRGYWFRFIRVTVQQG